MSGLQILAVACFTAVGAIFTYKLIENAVEENRNNREDELRIRIDARICKAMATHQRESHSPRAFNLTQADMNLIRVMVMNAIRKTAEETQAAETMKQGKEEAQE